MHIVLVVPGGVDRSGTERVIPVLLWLTERLAARHRVTVVAIGQEPTPGRWPLLGAEVINVAPIGPGIVGMAGAIRRVVDACGANGRPDVVHGFWASASGLAAVVAAKRHRVPSIVSAAGGELAALAEIGYGGGLGRGGRLIARGALRGASAVTVSSGWMADHLRACGYRVDDVIPLGVDRHVFTPPIDDSARIRGRLVHVASRNLVKDPFMLLEAFATVRAVVPHATLSMIGVDTLDGAVERCAATLGLLDAHDGRGAPALRILDYMPSPAIADEYRCSQLHVLSSLHDAAPVVVLEAAATRTPTVGTRVGHVTDFAALDPPAAEVVPTGNAPALAEAIIRLLTDDDRRHRLATAAYEWALANDADYTAASFERLYRRLLASAK